VRTVHQALTVGDATGHMPRTEEWIKAAVGIVAAIERDKAVTASEAPKSRALRCDRVTSSDHKSHWAHEDTRSEEWRRLGHKCCSEK
jgi:hypothetical protein